MDAGLDTGPSSSARGADPPRRRRRHAGARLARLGGRPARRHASPLAALDCRAPRRTRQRRPSRPSSRPQDRVLDWREPGESRSRAGPGVRARPRARRRRSGGPLKRAPRRNPTRRRRRDPGRSSPSTTEASSWRPAEAGSGCSRLRPRAGGGCPRRGWATARGSHRASARTVRGADSRRRRPARGSRSRSSAGSPTRAPTRTACSPAALARTRVWTAGTGRSRPSSRTGRSAASSASITRSVLRPRRPVDRMTPGRARRFRLGAYQVLFMRRRAPRRGGRDGWRSRQPARAGFVNAVLRRLARRPPVAARRASTTTTIAVRTGLAPWAVARAPTAAGRRGRGGGRGVRATAGRCPSASTPCRTSRRAPPARLRERRLTRPARRR